VIFLYLCKHTCTQVLLCPLAVDFSRFLYNATFQVIALTRKVIEPSLVEMDDVSLALATCGFDKSACDNHPASEGVLCLLSCMALSDMD
jgi:hypothetical protein